MSLLIVPLSVLRVVFDVVVTGAVVLVGVGGGVGVAVVVTLLASGGCSGGVADDDCVALVMFDNDATVVVSELCS